MTNNTCQSCKWWTMDDFRGDYKGCSNELIRDYSGDDDDAIPMVVPDYHYHDVGFHKDFGCIFHDDSGEVIEDFYGFSTNSDLTPTKSTNPPANVR